MEKESKRELWRALHQTHMVVELVFDDLEHFLLLESILAISVYLIQVLRAGRK